MPRLFGGVDGGGSGSRFSILDENGKVFAQSIGECTNQWVMYTSFVTKYLTCFHQNTKYSLNYNNYILDLRKYQKRISADRYRQGS